MSEPVFVAEAVASGSIAFDKVVLGALDEIRHTQIMLYFAHEFVPKDAQFDWAHKAYHTNDWAIIAARGLLAALKGGEGDTSFEYGIAAKAVTEALARQDPAAALALSRTITRDESAAGQPARATQPGRQIDGDERLADAGVAVQNGEFAARQVRLPQPADGFRADVGQGFGNECGHGTAPEVV